MKSFASDNYAGVLPEVMQALQRANVEHSRAYGADEITARTTAALQEIFGGIEDVLFVFNGTGANVLSLSAGTASYQSIICTDCSHIYNDESSAPESLTGCRVFALPADENGQLTCSELSKKLQRQGDVHFAQPGIVSITQTTEYGTVYSPNQIQAISRLCQRHNLWLHMDGSRYFNAVAHLGCSLPALSKDCGIDILSLGGTKLGLMFGEAVLVFNKELAKHIRYKQKQVLQLHSKTRFIAAQFSALLEGELWLKTALHANAMATLLSEKLSNIPKVQITKPVEANAVFAKIPADWNDALMAQFPFYVWQNEGNEVRLMCSWDTTIDDVSRFAELVRQQAKI